MSDKKNGSRLEVLFFCFFLRRSTALSELSRFRTSFFFFSGVTLKVEFSDFVRHLRTKRLEKLEKIEKIKRDLLFLSDIN